MAYLVFVDSLSQKRIYFYDTSDSDIFFDYTMHEDDGVNVASDSSCLNNQVPDLVMENESLKHEQNSQIKKISELTYKLKQASKELSVEKIEQKRLSKYICIMHDGIKNLDDILASQRIDRDRSGLVFKNHASSRETIFVKAQSA